MAATTTDAPEYMPLDGRLGSATMEGSSNGSGVTPQGVRAGDPAALRALVDRRGPAVVAFCTQVCGPAAATTAAAEAFARFRAAVRDAVELNGLDPETLLRGATRHAAASMSRTPVGPPPHGRLRSRGTQTCEHVPTMLAARANGALGDADLERIARHLDRCERCNALGEIFHRAELAYLDPMVDTLGLDTSTVLLEALESVPMQPIGTAPAPLEGGAGGSGFPPLDGAFGHLPDLEDEIPIETVPEAQPEPTLDVAHVAEPADELAAADLAAEPLPQDAPPPDATGEHDELDLGETMEWDVLPVVPGQHADGSAAAPVLLGGTHRRSGGPVRALLIALPVLVVTAFIAGALALSGTFGGDQGTPPQQTHRAPTGIEAPVTTPLPVKVKKAVPKAATGAAASTTTPAAGAGGATTASTATP
jgi:hypothetical protein